MFIAHLLGRTIRVEEGLVDQLFNSGEKRLALMLLLQAVAEHCGTRLLRLKGLVAIDEVPERPAVIHGVRHVVSAPEFLDRWPSADRRTRIVLITKGVPRHFVARLLDAIEEEVRDALSTSGGPDA